MVPNGWTLNNFNSVAELIHGFQFREHHFSESGVPIVKIASISHLRGISLEKCSYISEERASEFSKYKIEAGDVLMALTGGTLGKTCKVQEDIELCLQNYRVGNFKPKASFLDKDFLYYFLISFSVQKRIENIVNEAAQPNVGKADFDKIKVLTPPLPEQRKIAKILSTWDKAISTTERLIDISKQQKKALMQQLLTGKKRLLDEAGKPFVGEWEEVKLSDVFTLSSGDTKPKDVEKEQTNTQCFPVFGGNNIMGYSAKSNSTGNVILIGRVGEYCGVTRLVQNDCWITDNALFTKKFSADFDKQFIVYLLQKFDLSRLRNKGGQPLISQKPIYGVKIEIPSLHEQQKVASVLLNADREKEVLQQQLADLKQEKKALMQQLLTGKRRVKVDDKEVV